MPKGDEGFHTTFAEGLDDLSVMFDGGFIKFPHFWFNTRPFDGEAVGVEVEALQEVKVFFVSIPVIAGLARNIVGRIDRFRFEFLPMGIPSESRLRFSSEAFGILFLPFAPVIVLATFDLMRRSRSTPEEIFRKWHMGKK